MKSYAVIFTYSFDDEVVVYLFDTEEQAKKFLKESFEEEKRIDIEENEWDCYGYIEEDGRYAKLFNRFADRTDVTTFRVGQVYN